MRSISRTANEAIARQVVDRLCRRPPYGLSWRDFAVVEITRALTSAATDRRRKMNKVESDGIACSHEGYA
jgi:hypothetical protein